MLLFKGFFVEYVDGSIYEYRDCKRFHTFANIVRKLNGFLENFGEGFVNCGIFEYRIDRISGEFKECKEFISLDNLHIAYKILRDCGVIGGR